MQALEIVGNTLFKPDGTVSALGDLTALYLLAVMVAGAFVGVTYFACYFPQLRRLHRIRVRCRK